MRVLIVDPIDASGESLLRAGAELAYCQEASFDDIRRSAADVRTAWLINAGRGAVVEQAALVDALREKRIGGAMLDVYEHYRLEPGDPLLQLDNVVLTPHLAGMTVESRGRAGVLAAEDTLRMLAGERPRHLVNPEAWEAFTMRFSGKAKIA